MAGERSARFLILLQQGFDLLFVSFSLKSLQYEVLPLESHLQCTDLPGENVLLKGQGECGRPLAGNSASRRECFLLLESHREVPTEGALELPSNGILLLGLGSLLLLWWGDFAPRHHVDRGTLGDLTRAQSGDFSPALGVTHQTAGQAREENARGERGFFA